MIFCSARFRKLLALLIAFALPAICSAEPDPDAILRAARVNPLSQKISLKAQLANGFRKHSFRNRRR